MSSGTGSESPRDWSALMTNRCEPDSEPLTRTPNPTAAAVAQTVLGLRSQDLATYSQQDVAMLTPAVEHRYRVVVAGDHEVDASDASTGWLPVGEITPRCDSRWIGDLGWWTRFTHNRYALKSDFADSVRTRL